jgi:hypothetical protein
MIMDPFNRPDCPAPAINRPPMSMPDEVAAPHTADPISNTRKKNRNIH